MYLHWELKRIYTQLLNKIVHWFHALYHIHSKFNDLYSKYETWNNVSASWFGSFRLWDAVTRDGPGGDNIGTVRRVRRYTRNHSKFSLCGHQTGLAEQFAYNNEFIFITNLFHHFWMIRQPLMKATTTKLNEQGVARTLRSFLNLNSGDEIFCNQPFYDCRNGRGGGASGDREGTTKNDSVPFFLRLFYPEICIRFAVGVDGFPSSWNDESGR